MPRPLPRRLVSNAAAIVVLAAVATVVAACGGGGGGSVSVPPPATPTPASSTSAAQQAGASASTATFAPIAGGYSGSLTLPATSSGSGTVGSTLSVTQPESSPPLSLRRKPQTLTGANVTPLLFLAIASSATIAFTSTPSLTFVLPASVVAQYGASALYYVLEYDPTNPDAGWQLLLGPVPASGDNITFQSTTASLTFDARVTYDFALVTTATVLATPSPSPSPTVSPSASPSHSPSPSPSPSASATATASAAPEAGFVCPTSDGTESVARGGGSSGADAVRRAPARSSSAAQPAAGLLAVTYDRSTALGAPAHIANGELNAGAVAVRTLDFAHAGLVTHVVAVDPTEAASIAGVLRGLPGVRSVGLAGQRRYRQTVTTPYWTNDPYFDGFTAQQNTNAGNPNPSTFESLPYAESPYVPGQWDMHAIGLGQAFAYSQSNNGSSVSPNANALGSSSVKIAIVDTGQDTNHPELFGKIVYQHCFITSPNGAQSASSVTTDPDGHGTDVSGIAAANTNNGFGFTGTGGNVSIMGYRVFPTPDNNCTNPNTDDPQCSALDVDIASAIADAVNNGANVISMSLGGNTYSYTPGGCTAQPGVDDDPIEENAVQNALDANVIVVAASGNSRGTGVSAPACINGVIAVGATSLADGNPNGSAISGGSVSSPTEYVASYSQVGSPNASVHSASAWGIVAPGGDPYSDLDGDDLHWIENIWTQTPYNTNDEGECTDDYPNSSSTTPPVDCRVLIAGTSMATPHVAGAAALIISVSSNYNTSAKMKTLLCQTADDISDPREGCGRLNVYRALATALGDTHLP